MVSLALFRPMKVRETVIRARNDEAILVSFIALTTEKRKLK